LDLRVYIAIQSGRPFADEGNVFLHDIRHLYFGWFGRSRGRHTSAAGERQKREEEKNTEAGSYLPTYQCGIRKSNIQDRNWWLHLRGPFFSQLGDGRNAA